MFIALLEPEPDQQSRAGCVWTLCGLAFGFACIAVELWQKDQRVDMIVNPITGTAIFQTVGPANLVK